MMSTLLFAEQSEINSEPAAGSDTVSSPAPEEDATPEKNLELPSLKCDAIFLEYLKRQSPTVQDQNMKTYLAMNGKIGNEFMNDVENEFKWKSKENEYKEKYKELLSEKSNYVFRTNVRLGKYDFKKERFPLEFKTEKGNVLSYFSSGGTIGGNGYTGSITYCSDTRIAKMKFEIADIKVSNSKKQYYFNVSKELAEKITAKLRFDRQLDVKLNYVVEKSTGKFVSDYVDKKKKNLKLEISGKITEIHFDFFNDDSLGKISVDLY